MKLKDGLILRQVAGQHMIVPVGKRVREVRNMVAISSSAAYLWERMNEGEFTVEELTELILDHYTGVTREQAQADIEQFLAVLKKNHMLEREPGEPEEISGAFRIFVPKTDD